LVDVSANRAKDAVNVETAFQSLVKAAMAADTGKESAAIQGAIDFKEVCTLATTASSVEFPSFIY
jgi:hypothetical protein